MKELIFIDKKIEYLKSKLNNGLENKHLNDEEILRLSKELDLLINEYYNNIKKATPSSEEE